MGTKQRFGGNPEYRRSPPKLQANPQFPAETASLYSRPVPGRNETPNPPLNENDFHTYAFTSSHIRKPPKYALWFPPRRQPSGISSNFLALPPPITTYSA